MAATSRLTTAVHALCWLELARRRGEEPLSSERVAASLDSHPVLLRRCLTELKAAGLVRSGRGPGAGWSLARPAEEITLGQVWRAAADEPLFALHPHEPNLDCPVGFGIWPVLDHVYDDLRDAVHDRLARRTISEVLDDTLAVTAAGQGVSQ